MTEVRTNRKPQYRQSQRYEALRLSFLMTDRAVAERLGMSPSAISRWRHQVLEESPYTYDRLRREARARTMEVRQAGLPVCPRQKRVNKRNEPAEPAPTPPRDGLLLTLANPAHLAAGAVVLVMVSVVSAYFLI